MNDREAEKDARDFEEAYAHRCPGCGLPLADDQDTCGRAPCVEGVNGSPDYGELEAWLSRVESAPPARA